MKKPALQKSSPVTFGILKVADVMKSATSVLLSKPPYPSSVSIDPLVGSYKMLGVGVDVGTGVRVGVLVGIRVDVGTVVDVGVLVGIRVDVGTGVDVGVLVGTGV